ncbi:MAG: 5-formyltetrahydrofolate cyclo-ligase [Deltaproteobacteria bacterium]|nr:5-formyltetrahydrofolate cyclo-ligase [Deltaproteobacteria bacterium]
MNRFLLKERIRRELLEKRRSMAFEDVYRMSLKIQKRLLGTRLFRGAMRLSLYSSFQNEVLTDDIFQKAAEEGKEVYYPRVVDGKDRHLAFFKVAGLHGLSPGRYDILEPPEGAQSTGPEAFDLVVVPGVAFDARGSRLGYGKGYYDRALGTFNGHIIGLAYDFQVIESEIPVESHDVRVSGIITEKRIIRV